jgi:hypothetical protein
MARRKICSFVERKNQKLFLLGFASGDAFVRHEMKAKAQKFFTSAFPK